MSRSSKNSVFVGGTPCIYNPSRLSLEPVEAMEAALECWVTARKSLQSSHYGLASSSYLPIEYRKLQTHRYFHAKLGDAVLGVLRIIPSIPMADYRHNLNPDLVKWVDQGIQFSDLGFYYTEKISSVARSQVIQTVIDFCETEAKKHGNEGLYIHVPLAHAAFYRSQGFQDAGRPFQPIGWQKEYIPLFRLAAS